MATYYVNSSTGSDSNDGSSGAPWKTLNKAQTAITTNDTVIITGTFAENTTITKQGTTWKASGPGAAIIDGGWNDSGLQYTAQYGRYYITTPPTWGSGGVVAPDEWTALFSIRASDVTLDGLIMRNHAGQGVAIASAGDRTTVKNCRFDWMFNLALNSTSDMGAGNGNKDSVFENNVITRTSVRGIVTGYRSVWGSGIAMDSIRCVCRNNIVSHIWGEGIAVHHQAVDCSVYGNVVYNTMSVPLYVVTSQGSKLYNNLAFHTGDTGFAWSSGLVSEGLIIGDETESLNMGHNRSENTQFYNNIIVNYGRLLTIANGNSYVDNRVKGLYVGYNTFVAGPNTQAVLSIGKNSEGPDATDSMIENNIFLTRPGVPIQELAGGSYLTGIKFRNNLWSVTPDTRVQGTGDQVGPPNLANAFAIIANAGPNGPLPVNSNDYKLTVSSLLAIDKASDGSASNNVTPPTAARNEDFFYSARSGARDIGANEFGGGDAPPPPPPPSGGSNDMVQKDTNQCVFQTYLELSPATPYSGLRFIDVLGIPQGSTINGAYLLAEFYHSALLGANFAIRAEAADNPVDFVDTTNNLSGRAVTTATVNWTQTYAGTGVKTSPDIKTVIQEIVNRPGWEPGNFINLIFTANEWSFARFWGNRSGFTVPQLSISFTPPDETPPVDPPPPLPPGSLIPDPDGAIIRHSNSQTGYYPNPAITYELPRYVVRAGPNQTLFVTGHYLSNSSLVDFTVTVTYAGQTMTLVTSSKATNNSTNQQFVTGLWKLDTPPAGMANIVMTADRAGIDSATLAAITIKGRRKTDAVRIISPTWTETEDNGVYTSSPILSGCTDGGFLIIANTTSSDNAPLFSYEQANRRYSHNGGDNITRVSAAGAYRYVIPADNGSVSAVVSRNGGDATKMASIAVEILPNTDDPAIDRYISYGVA